MCNLSNTLASIMKTMSQERDSFVFNSGSVIDREIVSTYVNLTCCLPLKIRISFFHDQVNTQSQY